MKKDLKKIVANYYKCFYYDEDRLQAALDGDAMEINNIGTDFVRSQMFSEAIECWKFLVESGMPNPSETYSNLGVSYFYGNGVEVNYKEAVYYFQKATVTGHPFGMYNFAVALEQGKGIKTDLNRAISLYKQAAEKGVNQAIDALIRLGEYNELELAYYRRNLDDTANNINNFQFI